MKEKNIKWKFGEMVFDDKNNSISLKNYSWQTMSELFSCIAYYIGLSLKEYVSKEKGTPPWCFDDLKLPFKDKDQCTYSPENMNKAKDYYNYEILRISNLFLNFVDSEEKQEDVDKMFDELKKVFLSLWI